MAGLLIIAHAPLASAFKAVAAHAFPDSAVPLEVLDVEPGMTPEDIEKHARELLRRVRQPEALILSDVFGATPCNVAQRLADGAGGVRMAVGLNVPMLWRALCYAAEPVDELVQRALGGGVQGVMQPAEPPQQPPPLPACPFPHDQDEADHQQ